MPLWILGINIIQDLCHMSSRHPRVILVTYIVEVNTCESKFLDLNATRLFDPLAPKHGDLYIWSIVQFPYVLYEIIVCVNFPKCIDIFNTNPTILRHRFLVLCFGVECVSIYIICLPRCDLG